MSQYRNDRDAARQRIADLETRLAEREAALSAQDVAVAERDAEIARLRHQLVLAGILGHRLRPVHTAVGTRMVVLAVAVAGAALGMGILALRAPRPVIVEVVPAPNTPNAAAAQPILADPADVTTGVVPIVDEGAASDAVARDEREMRRELEPKVFAGRGTVEEIRMLKAICAAQGDRACRDRASALLPKAKPAVF
jgi:uncharacterized coiled-coil protein SlyX